MLRGYGAAQHWRRLWDIHDDAGMQMPCPRSAWQVGVAVGVVAVVAVVVDGVCLRKNCILIVDVEMAVSFHSDGQILKPVKEGGRQ